MNVARVFAAHEASAHLKAATLRLLAASTRLHRDMDDDDARGEFDHAVRGYHQACSRAIAELDDPDDWPLS
jgi:hypothetical protein